MNSRQDQMLGPVSFERSTDRGVGAPLYTAEEVLDLGVLPVPGLFFDTKNDAAKVESRVRLVRAQTDGLVQLDRDLNGKYYRYYKPGRATMSQITYLQKVADELAAAHPNSARILEIGGGAGHLMQELLKRGFKNLIIVDPSADSGTAVHCEVLPEIFPGGLASKENQFEVIVAQHFLEHVAEPVEILKAMRKLLVDGGKIYIEVPDLSASALEDKGYFLSMIYSLHSSYFDLYSLARVSARAGLKICDAKTLDHYGKSLVVTLAPGSGHNLQNEYVENWGIVRKAIVRFFENLKEFGGKLNSGTPCWGATERCLTILEGLISGGFVPGQILDSNPDIWGKFSSCMECPIENPSSYLGSIDELVMLSPRYAREIVRQNESLFRRDAWVHVPFEGSMRVSEILTGV